MTLSATVAYPMWRARAVVSPAGTPSITNRPSAPVTADSRVALPMLTCAPTSAAPVILSVTAPVTLPTSWA